MFQTILVGVILASLAGSIVTAIIALTNRQQFIAPAMLTGAVVGIIMFVLHVWKNMPV